MHSVSAFVYHTDTDNIRLNCGQAHINVQRKSKRISLFKSVLFKVNQIKQIIYTDNLNNMIINYNKSIMENQYDYYSIMIDCVTKLKVISKCKV